VFLIFTLNVRTLLILADIRGRGTLVFRIGYNPGLKPLFVTIGVEEKEEKVYNLNCKCLHLLHCLRDNGQLKSEGLFNEAYNLMFS